MITAISYNIRSPTNVYDDCVLNPHRKAVLAFESFYKELKAPGVQGFTVQDTLGIQAIRVLRAH